MIILRYVTKEVAGILLAVTGVLLLIFLSNQLVRYLGEAADGRLAGFAVLHLMVLEIPNLLSLLLPLCLFIAILLAYGRLYADSEMTVLSACGVGPLDLIGWVTPITITTVFLTFFLTFWLAPSIAKYRDQLLAQTKAAATLDAMLPGHFQEIGKGRGVVYVENISVNRKRMSNIFLAEQADTRPYWNVLSAENGYPQRDEVTGDHFIVSTNGRRYIGMPGSNDYQVIQYAKYGVRVETHLPQTISDEDSLSTTALWKGRKTDPQQAAALQWRGAIPLQALLLGFLAVPLSRLQPQQGKYARILPAILLYIVYANMLFVGRAWISHGVISPTIGMWWIHASVFFLALILMSGNTLWRYFNSIILRSTSP